MVRLSIECLKTKNQSIITLANQSRRKRRNEPIRIESKCTYARDRRQARENTCKRRMIGLVLHLIGWESGASFVDQSERAAMQNQSKNVITFDTELKTVLVQNNSGLWCQRETIQFYWEKEKGERQTLDNRGHAVIFAVCGVNVILRLSIGEHFPLENVTTRKWNLEVWTTMNMTWKVASYADVIWFVTSRVRDVTSQRTFA